MNLGETDCERDFPDPRHKPQVIADLLPRFVTPEQGNSAAMRPSMIRSAAPQIKVADLASHTPAHTSTAAAAPFQA